MTPETAHDPDRDDPSYTRRLLHRWLVQYNPLYLLSASLCLAGMILCSRGLAHDGNLEGQLGVAAIAELYALALIGGAALLTRIGQRRPAVLLALITALYQGDLTLHTETCACLGTVGALAAAGWLALFVMKLYALAWALRLRLTRGAAGLAAAGALGVALLPHALGDLSARGANAVVSGWLFGLLAGALYGDGMRGVSSLVPIDAWGGTVLRRSLRAVWLLWALLLVLHVAFWSLHSRLTLTALWPVPLLLGTRWLRREVHVWGVLLGTLTFVTLQSPEHLATAALLVSATLVVRARWHREAVLPSPSEQERARSPYRALDAEPPLSEAVVAAPELVRPSLAARRRMLSGALFGVYLAAWTLDWTGGAWPAHLLALDGVLSLAVLAAALRARMRVALVPLVATYAHFAVASRVVSAPQSPLGWGAASVAAGFVLLLGSLAASFFLRNVTAPGPHETR